MSNSSKEEEKPISFHRYPQDLAISTFLHLLAQSPHLPVSNPLHGRLQSPQNLPSRHCLFAATFPPAATPPETFTILFADRSRKSESQIWLFNPLCTSAFPHPLSPAHQSLLSSHMLATIQFLKHSVIPEAPGWPFSPILRFASLHEDTTAAIFSLSAEEGVSFVPHITTWSHWLISMSALSERPTMAELPASYTYTRVAPSEISLVISTSSIHREPSTMLALPSVGILNGEGQLIAWGYVGIDGSFATLYVIPEERGKGFASMVAKELLKQLGKGEFGDLGYWGKSGWVYSEVKDGNEGSEGVMRSLGATVGWQSSYLWVDSDKF